VGVGLCETKDGSAWSVGTNVVFVVKSISDDVPGGVRVLLEVCLVEIL